MKDFSALILFFSVFALSLSSPGNRELVPFTTVVENKGGTMASGIAEDTLQYDGPYVFYKNVKIVIKYILQVGGTRVVREDSLPLSQKRNAIIKVRSDEPGKFFFVQLKEKLEDEKNVSKNIKKQFVLSDIEGNFSAFRKLLQANRVIDTALNWTFGDGHLVLTGDFFDRGEQVTEVLWFIYSLEVKARAAGGYIHFILGNHEIMNLSGDLRYVNPKYTTNAVLMNEKYGSLYAENTELGRWLRTKNIVERIGDVLYIHGGISPELNRLGMSVKDIDRLARPYYADTTYNYKDPRLNIIFGDLGPFWYRHYYSGKTGAGEEQIDSTLSEFNVRHIATGHSIVADTVSSWYNGKLFNTDTHHAGGKSEALLIENGRYYRVNSSGTKVLLNVE
jgi:hypothetical protein